MELGAKGLCSIPEVREKVFGNNVPRGSIYRWIGKGVIPGTRIGGRIFVPTWWVDEVLSKPDQK